MIVSAPRRTRSTGDHEVPLRARDVSPTKACHQAGVMVGFADTHKSGTAHQSADARQSREHDGDGIGLAMGRSHTR